MIVDHGILRGDEEGKVWLDVSGEYAATFGYGIADVWIKLGKAKISPYVPFSIWLRDVSIEYGTNGDRLDLYIKEVKK